MTSTSTVHSAVTLPVILPLATTFLNQPSIPTSLLTSHFWRIITYVPGISPSASSYLFLRTQH
ncbi:hypothetical protein B0H17DRAFT_1108314, partial [Mycena rosella]